MPVTIRGSGQVPVQVVSMVTSTSTTTSSTAWSPTALTLSITPTNSANKILILVNTGLQMSVGGQPQLTVFRGATNLGGGTSLAFVSAYAGGGGDWRPASIFYLDSPATTSATTYTVNLNSVAGSVTACQTQITSTLTLMEISGA
jgi:hypothetical protein